MTDLEFLIDFHKNAKRQGPDGSFETKRALDFMGFEFHKKLNILDIGCGSGAQTLTLAKNTNGNITAVDLFPEFLEELNIKAKELNLQNKIKTKVASMDDLSFEENEFDLIWSEGAIYNMGFEKGIQKWKPFLKDYGYLAVTEISWITNSRPKELEEYWMAEYPEIDTISNKIKILEKNGFSPIAHFVLPEYCWIDNYYHPIEKRIPEFLVKHKNNKTVVEMMESEKEEIRIYKKYKEYFSYGFYIAQKTKV